MGNLHISPAEIKRVKGEGFLFNNDKCHFSGRVITGNGVVSSEQLRLLGEAAEKFGNGNVALTTRLTLEVTGITYENIEPFREFLAKGGMLIGGTGARVRPVVACKGTVCVFGLCDTQRVATEIHRRFFEGYHQVILPHKFKIAVGGCPNNCVKPDLNDIGLVGQRKPKLNSEVCKSCKKCSVEQKCPMGAAKATDGTVIFQQELCNNCSRCVTHCPFDAVSGERDGFRVYIGGRWGKKVRQGNLLPGIFSEAEALNLIEKSLLLFRERGEQGERFASMIERLGVAEVEKELLSDEILARKEKILS